MIILLQNIAKAGGYSVVQQYVGHGTGAILHMPPYVMHHKNKTRLPLREGMVFTIEPIIVEADPSVEVWSDKWTVVTEDGGWSVEMHLLCFACILYCSNMI
jgi:methionyl aminopeptidase